MVLDGHLLQPSVEDESKGMLGIIALLGIDSGFHDTMPIASNPETMLVLVKI